MTLRTTAGLAAAFGLALSAAQPAAAQQVIQINSSLPEGSFAHVFLQEFESRVETALPGAVDLQIFMGNTLGSEEDVLQGMSLGTHQPRFPPPPSPRSIRAPPCSTCPTSSRTAPRSRRSRRARRGRCSPRASRARA